MLGKDSRITGFYILDFVLFGQLAHLLFQFHFISPPASIPPPGRCRLSLHFVSQAHETVRLKSGAWDKSGVFVFNTLSHIKYCLVNGDSGIVRTLELPVHFKVQGDIVQCLDRDGKSKTILVDSTEFMFKAALHRRDLTAVKRIVLSSRNSGHAIIRYLQRKGYGAREGIG